MTTLQGVTDKLEQQLRNELPKLAEYLDMTIVTRSLWGGGFDVLGVTYATTEEAEDARRAAIMGRLLKAQTEKEKKK